MNFVDQRRDTRVRTLLCHPLTYERVQGAMQEEYNDAMNDIKALLGLSLDASVPDIVFVIENLMSITSLEVMK